jgi:hypothetical protein
VSPNGYAIRRHIPPPDHVALERMAAADLVLLARRAGTAAQGMTLDEREAHAKRFESLIQELEVAALLMRQGAPADRDYIPPVIREGASDASPGERRGIFLRRAADALVHD